MSYTNEDKVESLEKVQDKLGELETLLFNNSINRDFFEDGYQDSDRQHLEALKDRVKEHLERLYVDIVKQQRGRR